jgi:hypothetical protein
MQSFVIKGGEGPLHFLRGLQEGLEHVRAVAAGQVRPSLQSTPQTKTHKRIGAHAPVNVPSFTGDD